MRPTWSEDGYTSEFPFQQHRALADVTVFVIEPDELQRRQIGDAITNIPGLAVVGDAAGPDREVSEAAPDLLLINSSLLHGNVSNLRALAHDRKAMRLVFFSPRPSVTTLLDARDLPVCGLLSFNHLSSQEFARSLITIALGGAVIEPVSAMELLVHLRRQSGPLAGKAPLTPLTLTKRESQVMALVREGLANKEIASQTNMSLGTVRAHLRSIFSKLDVSSRTGAAMAAAELSLTYLHRPASDGGALRSTLLSRPSPMSSLQQAG